MRDSAERAASRGRAGESERFVCGLEGCGLPEAVATPLLSAGFNLAGVLRIADYDSLVPLGWRSENLLPTARVAVLLACGGQAFSRALASQSEFADSDHPVEHYAERVVTAAAQALCSASWETRAYSYLERRGSTGEPDAVGGEFLDFVALAGACGMGETGRLRLLLHPSYGPWLALRGLLLSEIELPATAAGGKRKSDPCANCDACIQACPVHAFSPAGQHALLDRAACYSERLGSGACATRCAARRACVVGPQYAYDASVEAHHMHISPQIRDELELRIRGLD